ncbi:MAG: hypothetical protein KAX44_02210 [Candidatus Brocadiae bacterium]|nr:hypothetical protein [Candidatus Brocadiia bacterium]
MIVRSSILLLVAFFAPVAYAEGWELRRDDLDKERPAVEEGVATVTIGEEPLRFPRYLNEIGVQRIRIRFRGPGTERQKLSVVWSGGSRGTDTFAVQVNGISVGMSQTVESPRRPYAWYRDDFAFRLAPGSEHVLEISSPPEFSSAIEFAGIRMAAPDVQDYQPLCYESIASLQRYEKELGRKGTVVKSAHLWVFAPHQFAEEANALASFLERAYAEMKDIYGMGTVFKFSVEHYPRGHKRGWGGISGGGTIGYTIESLQRFGRLGTGDVRGFAGYTEEMSHGFNAYYKCGGTYEALGVAVQEEVVRRLVPRRIADAFWLREHEKWDDTQRAYLAAGCRNPDPGKYPWNVLYTRILNGLFLKLRNEYGPAMWRDFFRQIRETDYPLHRAKKTERMRIYADIFSELFGRDMRKEFTEFGIDLDADPPWGWETYKNQQ